MHNASVQPYRISSFCGSDDISMEIRYPNNNGRRRVEIKRKASADTIIMASFNEINFMTHFQSLGLFWFLLHFAVSSFHFAWSWLVRKVEEVSFERGKRSFPCNGRSLHPFLAITVNLKTNKDPHQYWVRWLTLTFMRIMLQVLSACLLLLTDVSKPCRI